MKVLITGATGFIGRHLCRALWKRGHTLNVLTREPKSAAARLGVPVSAFFWDASKNVPPEESFAGVEGVIHLAGEGIADKRWSDTQKKRIYDSRIVGTRHRIQSLRHALGGGPSHSKVFPFK